MTSTDRLLEQPVSQVSVTVLKYLRETTINVDKLIELMISGALSVFFAFVVLGTVVRPNL